MIAIIAVFSPTIFISLFTELYRNIGTDIGKWITTFVVFRYCFIIHCLILITALCVVGNKTDLPKELRKVPAEKGKEYAKSLNSLFAESSAAHDIGMFVIDAALTSS